ncbi:MAG: hypothetical protein QNJ91_08505 [Gammaproteobacteria bacterium]|nr:hypothetical protein [Gammaproteobacteria bacterium]
MAIRGFHDLCALPRRFAWLALPACLATAPAVADVGLSFGVDDISGEGWQLSGLGIEIGSAAADRLSLAVSVASAVLPDDHGRLREVRLSCAMTRQPAGGWHCDDGRLTATESPLGAQQTTWSGAWHADGSLVLEVPGLRVAGGRLTLSLAQAHDGWQLTGEVYRVPMRRAAELADLPTLPADWNSRGRASGRVVVRGAAARSTQVDTDLVIDGLNYASPDGTQAAEGLVVKVDATARDSTTGWRFDGSLRWPKGALYVEPVFHDAATAALRVDLSGTLLPAQARLDLAAWTVELDGAFSISGTGRFATRPFDIRDLTVAAHSDDAGRLYDLLVQPFLIGTPADDMAVQGSVGFVMHFDDTGVEQVGLELNGLAFSDRKGRFALRRTDGGVAWDRGRDVSVSRLSTRGVSLLRIDSGAFAIQARFAADRVELVEPIVVPLLGGAVALDSFALDGALVAGDRPSWTASASVRDVSLDELTRELEWPPFSGKLAGELREMRYVDQVFTIGGGLRLAAFNGEIRVDDLRIQNPLGAVPILGANATLRGLDLEAVTRTFAFGRITGKLDGDIGDLRLVAWEPERFDLHLYTPAGDRSRHRISQRAVENLTELGSGLPAGLSTSFLRIFDEFSYDSIDVKIALRGNAATIDGLAREDGGYYLVRGSGLPRIDVIGRNRSVAWTELLERLREIRVEGVRIQ